MQLMQGVGPTAAQRVLDYIATASRSYCGDPLGSGTTGVPAMNGMPSLPLSRSLRAEHTGWPGELERARLWYEPHLERIHEDDAVRGKPIWCKLQQIARRIIRPANAS